MTERYAPGLAACNPAGLSLAPWVRGCVVDDWLVLLDMKLDRYWALSSHMPSDELRSRLNAIGLLGAAAPSQSSHGDARGLQLWRSAPELWAILDAGLWANSIIRAGRLDLAFHWLAGAKSGARCDPAAIKVAYLRFEQLRVWLPKPYVCLFNSLALMRFLIRKRLSATFVIGVRAMPFAAHCWIEVGNVILDAGGEECGSFTEIARV